MRDAILGIVISCLICLAPPLGLAGQPLIPLPDGACARLGLGALQCMDVSPDGRTLALGTSLGIEVRDASSLELRSWIAC